MRDASQATGSIIAMNYALHAIELFRWMGVTGPKGLQQREDVFWERSFQQVPRAQHCFMAMGADLRVGRLSVQTI